MRFIFLKGFAHFIEHLGFKGTKTYPGYELVNRLAYLGVVYGADLNASTHLLETSYRLSLQSDADFSKLRLGVSILKEWAFHMNISESDISEERNVILSEYVSKQGLSQRLLATYWKAIFEDRGSVVSCRLANRMPIGKPDIFMSARS
jgi:zinc protease